MNLLFHFIKAHGGWRAVLRWFATTAGRACFQLIAKSIAALVARKTKRRLVLKPGEFRAEGYTADELVKILPPAGRFLNRQSKRK